MARRPFSAKTAKVDSTSCLKEEPKAAMVVVPLAMMSRVKS
jgi:hypothetical protein